METPIIIIDAGHGGYDPGGGTNNNWKEKDLALKISLYQQKRFNDLGVPVALTRKDDVYLSPEHRTKLVKESGAKYCLSNHINAGGGDGAEFIHSIYADGKLEHIMAEMIKSEGQNVRRIFTRNHPRYHNKDYYFMHRETGAAKTTIVEYGFADSKKDDVNQLLENWKVYAEAIVKAYCSFLGYSYKPVIVEHPKEKQKGLYRVQIGAFSQKENAERLLENAKQAGFKNAFIKYE